ncbi:hypothetical protein B0H17DRAFT_1028169 [Mycena rosella]|uniref:Secreted protein n=1 Tax=Mycena rosella TaxID=1033263 RepID=A0AAD7H0K5_MYCRO|nr:hypothetical protein B0H17DRAFT_1028169 [Mycena rosella]
MLSSFKTPVVLILRNAILSWGLGFFFGPEDAGLQAKWAGCKRRSFPGNTPNWQRLRVSSRSLELDSRQMDLTA